MFSVNFATTIHHLFRKGHVSEPLGKSTCSTIIESSMIANTYPVHMSKTFQPDTRKIGGYFFTRNSRKGSYYANVLKQRTMYKVSIYIKGVGWGKVTPLWVPPKVQKREV